MSNFYCLPGRAGGLSCWSSWRPLPRMGRCRSARLFANGDRAEFLVVAFAAQLEHHAWLEPRPRPAFTNGAALAELAADVVSVNLRIHEIRSAERRVGKECVSTCRFRCSP